MATTTGAITALAPARPEALRVEGRRMVRRAKDDDSDFAVAAVKAEERRLEEQTRSRLTKATP